MNLIIVDDNEAIIKKYKRDLKGNININSLDFFSSASKALEYVKNHKVDVAILDIRLIDDNDTEGIELAKEINIYSPATRIIFATDYSNYLARVQEDDVNSYAYIMKPINKETLEKKLLKIKNETLGFRKKYKAELFGEFNIYKNDEPLVIKNIVDKRILAYLIVKNGKEISSSVMLDNCIPSYVKNQREYKRRFIEMLKKNDLGDLIIETRNANSQTSQTTYRINRDVLECDYYNFIDKDPEAIASYTSEFCINLLKNTTNDDCEWIAETQYRLDMLKGGTLNGKYR